MTLDEYLSLPDSLTAAQLGAKCEPPISEATVSRIRRGLQNVTADVMLSIIVASGGVVTAEGLLSRRQAA